MLILNSTTGRTLAVVCTRCFFLIRDALLAECVTTLRKQFGLSVKMVELKSTEITLDESFHNFYFNKTSNLI